MVLFHPFAFTFVALFNGWLITANPTPTSFRLQVVSNGLPPVDSYYVGFEGLYLTKNVSEASTFAIGADHKLSFVDDTSSHVYGYVDSDIQFLSPVEDVAVVDENNFSTIFVFDNQAFLKWCNEWFDAGEAHFCIPDFGNEDDPLLFAAKSAEYEGYTCDFKLQAF